MKRFTEPSTWAGIAAIASMLAAFLPPQYQLIAQALTAGAGAAAIKLREAS
jgi:hypothetical protein